MQAAVRGSDEVCRLGGEEFVIICRNTDEQACVAVAERVRTAMEAHVVKHPGFDRAVTVSLGIACSEAGYENVGALLKAADQAVYLAKELGRNRTCLASQFKDKKKSA
jgi:diguanylate cyclase (GGDEF)-like protein